MKTCIGMGTLESNKQDMKYATLTGSEPVYRQDADGNVLYTTVNGKKVPVETGEMRKTYSEPVDFKANISEGGGKAEAAEFGIDLTEYDAVILTRKSEFPINESSVIWHNRPVKHKGGLLDISSADYKVVRVTNSLNYTRYLVKRQV